MNKSRWAAALRRGISYRPFRLAATVAIVAIICSVLWSVIAQHAQAIAASAAEIEWGLVALTVGFCTLYRLCNAAVWKTVLGSLGCDVPVRFATAMWIQSETCRWLPGSVWNLGSRVYIGARYGLSKTVVSAGIALELALTVASWCTLCLMGVVLYGTRIFEFPGTLRISEAILPIAIAIVVLVTSLSLLSGTISRKVRRVFDQFRWLSCVSLLRRNIGRACIDYFVLGIANGVICWIVVYATLGDAPMSIGEVIAINALAWLVGFFAIFAPAGLGVREATFAILFSVWVPFDRGLLAAGVWRLVQVGSEIICCLLAITILRLRQQSFPAAAPQSTDRLQIGCQPPLTAALSATEV